jgi:hypothetical protein
MQEVSPPALGHAWNFGQLIAGTGCDEDAPGTESPVPGENDGDTGVEPNDLIFDQRHAIRADLGAPGGEQIRRRHAVARQEAVHVHRRRIAGLPGVDHGNPSSGSTHAATGHGSAAATQRFRRLLAGPPQGAAF